MRKLEELILKGDSKSIWQKYCGFVELSLADFMEIQKSLLFEQIDILDKCQLGRMLFGDNKPRDIDEFRERVPLTSYDFYAPYFNRQDEDILPEKPEYWICTTWKGGTHPFKWAPYTQSMVRENVKAFIASMIFATSKGKEKIRLKPKDKFLYGMAPLPYFTGIVPYGLSYELEFDYLPDIDTAEKMSFEERNQLGFQMGLEKGIDIFFGVSSVLLRIGEKFQEGLISSKTKSSKKSILSSFRVLKGMMKSKIEKRPMLPKDIWNLKGIICGGTDTRLYKDSIEHLWGVKPLEAYAGTELSIVATQTWNYKDLTFFPDVNFLEFITEEESIKCLKDTDYIPKTLLLDEVEAGKTYELVTTKFKGGAFVRYRVGDLVKITSLGDDEVGTKIPQMIYVDRVSHVIDLSAFTRLTEDLIQKAIHLCPISCNKWFGKKEINSQNQPFLHLYFEQSWNTRDVLEIEELLHYGIGQLDPDYRNLEIILGQKPIKVTLLKSGTWNEYKKIYKAFLPTINPPCSEIERLLEISQSLDLSVVQGGIIS